METGNVVENVPVAAENIIEHAAYGQIYRILEEEFAEIGKYVAFTDGNVSAYSAKIHELLLRVCSEIENVLKIILHRDFIAADEVQALWDEKKGVFLERVQARLEYEALARKLNSDGRQKLDRSLFGFPDFSFYFALACAKFRLDRKTVEFTASLSNGTKWRKMVPFSKPDGADVPEWWSRYNKLKHAKIASFSSCTLGDLGQAMAGFFIIMNYLLRHHRENPHIPNRDYHLVRASGRSAHSQSPFCALPSEFFIAPPLRQDPRLEFCLPDYVEAADFSNRPAVETLKMQIYRPLGAESNRLSVPLARVKLDSFEWAMHGDPAEALFYTFLDFERIIDAVSNRELRERRHFAKFCN